MTLVSVIMPAFNSERYIAQAIRTVIAQTVENWELIVVDDGSMDGTAAVVAQFVKQDSRVKYVYQKNAGLGNARNTAFRHSSGDLIAFLDSDDLWLSNKLQLQIDAMTREEVDVVYTNGFIFAGDNIADESTTFPIIPGQRTGPEMLNELLIRNSIPVLSVMARRRVLEDAGGFNEDVRGRGCEDYDLWLRLARQGATFFGLDEKLVRYRRHAAAMTHADSNLYAPMLEVFTRHCDSSSLPRVQLRSVRRDLNRRLILALVQEGSLTQAKQAMKEFASWDRIYWVTQGQRLLLSISSRNYALISREFFYRIEWHANRLVRTLQAIRLWQKPTR
jgi:teichuronic acid biosynthesis glycosyltransferase TuaG